MRTYTLNDFMAFPRLALFLTMVLPFNWCGAPHYRFAKLRRLFFVLGAFNLIYQNVGLLIYVFVPQQQQRERPQIDYVLQLAETGGVMGLTMVAACKMLLLFWHGDNITQLIEQLQQIFPSVDLQRQQQRRLHQRHLKNFFSNGFYPVQLYARRSHRLMKLTAIFFMFAFCWYNMLPLLLFVIELRTPNKPLTFIYQSNTWYPWQAAANAQSCALYVLTFLCQMHSSLTGVAFIMAGEFMLCFFITQMQMHFDYLADALEHLDAGAADANKQLKRLIDYHNMLLRFSSEINKIFNISFLINFATSSIAICLMGFSMMTINIFNAAKFLVGLLSFLVFTLFICYNGSEFTNASDKLMLAAFYNNWYEGNMAYRKMILFFIMRSVRPSVLHAYKFTMVSMPAFMAILKFSYQLFTFIRAMG